MNFIDSIKQRAKNDIKTILLPEAEDIRILKATEEVLNEKYADIILIGEEEKILKKANEEGINIKGAKIVNHLTSEKREEYIQKLYELRKEKGLTLVQAEELLKEPIYFGMMMLKDENTKADGLVRAF